VNWKNHISQQLDHLLADYEKKIITKEDAVSLIYKSESKHVLCQFNSSDLYLTEFSVTFTIDDAPEISVYYIPSEIIGLLQDSLVADTKTNVKFSDFSTKEVDMFINTVFKNKLTFTTYEYKKALFKVVVEALIRDNYKTLDCYLYPTEELEMPILSKKYFYKPFYSIIEKFFKGKVKNHLYEFNL